MAYRISTLPIVEIGAKIIGGEYVRGNDGALIIRDDGRDDDAPNLRLIVPRVAQVKRSDPYDKPDPEQEAFAAHVVALLNRSA
jgi:hypothetical protein